VVAAFAASLQQHAAGGLRAGGAWPQGIFREVPPHERIVKLCEIDGWASRNRAGPDALHARALTTKSTVLHDRFSRV